MPAVLCAILIVYPIKFLRRLLEESEHGQCMTTEHSLAKIADLVDSVFCSSFQ